MICASTAPAVPRRSRYPAHHRTDPVRAMNAVAHAARPFQVEIDRDNWRCFDFIGIVPFDCSRRVVVSARGACRRGRSLFVLNATELLQASAGKVVRCAVDGFPCPVRRNIPLGRERGSRMHKLVGVGRFRVPDHSAANTADLAPVRGQACQIHFIGRSAGHRRITARRFRENANADPLTNWKPCGPARGPCYEDRGTPRIGCGRRSLFWRLAEDDG